MSQLQTEELILSALLTECVTMIILQQTGWGGNKVREWYRGFGLGAFCVDVLSMILGFLLGILLKDQFYPSSNSVSHTIFFVLIVQIVHDSLLWIVHLKHYKGTSPVWNILREYGDEIGQKILVTDAIMMLSITLLYTGFTSNPITKFNKNLMITLVSYISLVVLYSF